MKEPQIKTFRRDGRAISCAVWESAKEKPPVLCVHGLTRNGRDFDYFASALSDSRSVYCPDMAGRGRSDWLPAGQLYTYDLYAEDVLFLLDQLGLTQVDWVGTSMGGILGMRMAGEHPQVIRKMVTNDIGAIVTLKSMQRLHDYVGRRMVQPSLAHAENYLRTVYAGFGLTEHWQWDQLLRYSFAPVEDSKRYRLLYDPQIINAIRDKDGNFILTEDVNLWPYWEKISQPTLLMRGQNSDFLSHDLAQEMVTRHPNATLQEISNCGHAPALMTDDQVSLVREWLDR